MILTSNYDVYVLFFLMYSQLALKISFSIWNTKEKWLFQKQEKGEENNELGKVILDLKKLRQKSLSCSLGYTVKPYHKINKYLKN